MNLAEGLASEIKRVIELRVIFGEIELEIGEEAQGINPTSHQNDGRPDPR